MLVFQAISLVGCSFGPRRDTAPAVSIMEFSEDGLKARRAFEGIDSIRAEVKVRVSRDGRKVASFKGALAYRPPDTMRLRMFTPFGTTAADLVRVVGRTEVLVPGKDNLYVGWTPSLAIPDDAEFKVGLDKAMPVLAVFSGGEAVARYLYDQKTGDNIQVESFSGGQRALVMRFGDFDGTLAINAAKLSHDHKLPLADSIILATARARNAKLWTQDADFEGMDRVEYRSKQK